RPLPERGAAFRSGSSKPARLRDCRRDNTASRETHFRSCRRDRAEALDEGGAELWRCGPTGTPPRPTPAETAYPTEKRSLRQGTRCAPLAIARLAPGPSRAGRILPG